MAIQTATFKNLKKNKKEVFKTAANTHDTVIENADSLLDSIFVEGAKWQKVTAKAIKKSEPLMNKQLDMMFDTLEAVQDQVAKGTKRFRSLIGFTDKDFSRVKKTFTNKVTTAKSDVENTVKSVKKTVNKKATRKGSKDNLKQIKGIGPKLEGLLNKAGIKKFEDLIDAPMDLLTKVLETAGSRFKNLDPSVWAKQAKELMQK